MTPRNAHRIHPRDSMYTPGEMPLNLPHEPRLCEPETWLESWPFLLSLGAVVLTLGWFVAQGVV